MPPEGPAAKYVTEVKRSLNMRGYWGHSAKKLLDELNDHYLVKFEQLKLAGHNATEAQKRTEEALGNPQAIASEWASVLGSGSWIARHPGVTAVLGFVCLWSFYYLLMVMFSILSNSSNHLRALELSVGPFAVNWLPWAGGTVFLIWKTLQAPFGWRPLLWYCLSLAMATSAWQVQCTVYDKTGLPLWCLSGTTWMSLWAYPLCWFLNILHNTGFDRPGFWTGVWFCPNLFKLVLPPLACWAAQSYFTAVSKSKGDPHSLIAD